MERPKPIALRILEGDVWIPWRLRHRYAIRGMGIPAHAIKFEDGSTFDTIEGWKEPDRDVRNPKSK